MQAPFFLVMATLAGGTPSFQSDTIAQDQRHHSISVGPVLPEISATLGLELLACLVFQMGVR